MIARTIGLFLAALSLGSSAQAAPLTFPSGITVTTTAAGPADGKRPTEASLVRVHYRGTLENGTEFDSSYKRGQPAVFPLNQVIPCWTVGIQTLTVGTKAVLTCPGATAYGERGIPGVIPSNATLRFEVELLAIVQ